MSKIVKVGVPRPLWQTFDYLVPKDFVTPKVGCRVRVPFGRTSALGIVVEHATESRFELKPLLDVVDTEPLLSDDLMYLASWMSHYYHYPIGSVLETMLPKLVRRGNSVRLDPELMWSTTDDALGPLLKRARKQMAAWQKIHDQRGIAESNLRVAGIDRRILRELAKKGLIRPSDIRPKYQIQPTNIQPSDEQNLAIDNVTENFGKFGVHLLYGITGSGKTEVYLRLIERMLARGQQALVLVPEIALTPQTVSRFRDRFLSCVTLHSKIPDKARFATWSSTANGDHKILIGTRSAVFAPFQDLGLIVIDEEHDSSYKQIESLRYSGRDAAIVRAQSLGIPCVLGTATPSLETLQNVARERYTMHRLSRRAGAAQLPKFGVIDTRGLQLINGLSEPLLRAMSRHLDDNSQVLILINRRGYAPILFCTTCGYQATCEDCDVRLTIHEFPRKKMQCHHCLAFKPVPSQCPACGRDTLQVSGMGTQRIEQALHQQFPNVPIQRVDSDSITSHRKLYRLFEEIQKLDRGILVGTQMLSKGHHFPKVTLVAVINADGGFLTNDFRGPEKTAQLIIQVAGRAGRAERPGEVLIQSFEPNNPDLVSLVKYGYEGFAKAEQRIRKEAELPPFSYLALLRSESENEMDAESFLRDILDEARVDGIEILGPLAAPIPRISKRWRFQAGLLSSDRQFLHSALQKIEKAKPHTSKVRWSIDVDPVDMA